MVKNEEIGKEEDAQDIVDVADNMQDNFDEEEPEEPNEDAIEDVRDIAEERQAQQQRTQVSRQVQALPKFEQPRKQKEQQKFLDTTRQNMRMREMEERKQSNKIAQERAEFARQEKILKGLQRGSSVTGGMASQLAGQFGLTREGAVGKQLAEQRRVSQQAKVTVHNKRLSSLQNIQKIKEKQYKSDGKISIDEAEDMNKLIDKIGVYQQKANVEQNVLDKLSVNKVREANFQYMTPAMRKQIGITKTKLKKPKKQRVSKQVKRYTTSAELSLKKILKEPRVQQPSEINEINDEELQGQIKQPAKTRRNRYGVDDWIMDL